MGKQPGPLSAVLQMKCPRCRKGQLFINKSMFPLKHMLDMHERCPQCGQKTELEVGFYYGTGYVSYGLSIAIMIFNAIWFALFVGFSFKDDSVFWYVGISVVMLILMQPWLMRLSRVLYLSMFVKYNKKAAEQAAESLTRTTEKVTPTTKQAI